MSAAEAATPVGEAEAADLFADLKDCPALVLAVSGGPDSTALLWLAARWRSALRRGPKLVAVTVDHGLRPEARREAAAVKRLAASLGVAHRTLRWAGEKPATGLQEAARTVRYRLLAATARRVRARAIVTAHTLDDQAETVLFRLARGSGVTGLAGMARIAPPPLRQPAFSSSPVRGEREQGVLLIRPLLDIPKARLIATLQAAGVPFAEDPANRDPRFARTRLRALTAALAVEGLTAARFAQFARRMRRADAAIEAAVDRLAEMLAPTPAVPRADGGAPLTLPAGDWAQAPAELRLRLLGRLIAAAGDEGAVELGKLETCESAMMAHCSTNPFGRFRRTLAGAVITISGGRLTVARAPPRRPRRRPTA